jgi:hypothetical protein
MKASIIIILSIAAAIYIVGMLFRMDADTKFQGHERHENNIPYEEIFAVNSRGKQIQQISIIPALGGGLLLLVTTLKNQKKS